MKLKKEKKISITSCTRNQTWYMYFLDTPAKYPASDTSELEKSVTYVRGNFWRMNLPWNCILGKRYINGCRTFSRNSRSKIDRVKTLLSY